MLKERVDFRLFNVKGPIVFRSIKEASKFQKTIGLQLNDLARGMYILNVSININILDRRVLVR